TPASFSGAAAALVPADSVSGQAPSPYQVSGACVGSQPLRARSGVRLTSRATPGFGSPPVPCASYPPSASGIRFRPTPSRPPPSASVIGFPSSASAIGLRPERDTGQEMLTLQCGACGRAPSAGVYAGAHRGMPLLERACPHCLLASVPIPTPESVCDLHI